MSGFWVHWPKTLEPSTKTHQNVGKREIDEIDVGGGLHVGVSEDDHQDADVAHHSHQEDEEVAEVHDGLHHRQEDVGLVLVTQSKHQGWSVW